MKKNILENFNNFQAKTSPNPLKIAIKNAKGSYITDFDNKKYLDFIAGVSVCTLGHRHPKIIKAIKNQLDKYLHVMVYGEFAIKTTTDLAKEVINLYDSCSSICWIMGTDAFSSITVTKYNLRLLWLFNGYKIDLWVSLVNK